MALRRHPKHLVEALPSCGPPTLCTKPLMVLTSTLGNPEAGTASDAIPLGIAIVAISLGLRIGEAASLCNNNIITNRSPPGIWFTAEKLTPDKQARTFRSPPAFAMGWAAYLASAHKDMQPNAP